MKSINKGAEPNSLTLHRLQTHSDYNNYTQKDDLRAALFNEQKGLCCYCTGRIRVDSFGMKIEHWKCQTTYPQQQLAYGNLLGACLGGEGKPPAQQHCDTRKANYDLKWNPADPAHAIESRLHYLADGTVESVDQEFNTQINEVLGLNLSYFKNSRKAALDAVLLWWRDVQPVQPAKVQRQIDRYTVDRTELEPFSPVVIWFLKRKLGGAAV